MRKIPYVVMAGENEIKNNRVTIKIMSSGEQKELTPANLIDFLKA
jgi:histidyl-tRNA synthetase